MATKYKQERSAKSGRTIKKGTAAEDKDTTYTQTIKRRHKFTIIFDLFKDAYLDTDKRDELIEQAQEKISKLFPEEKAVLIEIASAIYHEASVATESNKK